MSLRIVLLFVFCSLSVSLYSQDSQEPETTGPSYGTEIFRDVVIMDIDGKEYRNVEVILKSNAPDYVWTTKSRVKVTVMNKEGRKVWKNTFKNSFLYIFSSGQIQVGQKNFSKVLIERDESTGQYYGMIREKEGIY